MPRNMVRIVVMTAALGGVSSPAAAALPFAEDFSSGMAGWRFSNSVDLTAVPSGGADDSPYVSHTFAFSTLANPMATSTLIFRAQDEFNSSGQQYVGNWIAAGVNEVTAFVRHTASEPLVFNARFANAANFPGASYLSAAVPAGVWTQLTFDVTSTSPQNVTYEGTDYNTVFSSIGHIQFGVNIPASLQGATTPFSFDLDTVRVNIPEPAAGGLAVLAAGALALAARRRR